MGRRTKRWAALMVEQMEDRCVPAYLVSDPGFFEVFLGSPNIGRAGAPDFEFDLSAQVVTRSNRYAVTMPNGDQQWWAVTSNPIQEIDQPTVAEWNLLAPNDFSGPDG